VAQQATARHSMMQQEQSDVLATEKSLSTAGCSVVSVVTAWSQHVTA